MERALACLFQSKIKEWPLIKQGKSVFEAFLLLARINFGADFSDIAAE